MPQGYFKISKTAKTMDEINEFLKKYSLNEKSHKVIKVL